MGDQHGVTALHMAARSGHTIVVKELINGGAQPNKTDICGETPLHAAIRTRSEHDKEKMVELLLERGADPNIANDQGRTPLAIAREMGLGYSKIALILRGYSFETSGMSMGVPSGQKIKAKIWGKFEPNLDHMGEK